MRGGVTGASLQTFMDKAVGALQAGAIDGRDDTTFTWMPVRLDQRGWDEITTIMQQATDRALDAQRRSRRRLAGHDDADAISAVVAFANFETGGSFRALGRYSHSIVAGGLDEMSRATRLTSRISLMIRFETRSRRS